MSENTWPDWLTREQAATYANVSLRTLRRWMEDGRLPYSKVTRAVRIRRVDLERLLTDNMRGRSVA